MPPKIAPGKMMAALSNLLIVALGGSLGAVSRYVVSEGMYRRFGDGFPWGTLAVNLSGCLLMGMLMGIGLNSNHRYLLLFGVGFLGSLTTFSAFSIESIRHASDGQLSVFLANILINVIGCLFAAWLGILLVKYLGGSVAHDT